MRRVGGLVTACAGGVFSMEMGGGGVLDVRTGFGE